MVLWGVVEAGAWSVMIWGLVGCNMYGGHKVPRHNHARQRTLQLVALCIFLAVRHAAKDLETNATNYAQRMSQLVALHTTHSNVSNRNWHSNARSEGGS